MDENTGQGTQSATTEGGERDAVTPSTQTGGTAPEAGNEVQELQQELVKVQSALDEQRRIQAGQDRTIAKLQSEKEALEKEIERLNQVAIAGDSVKEQYEQELNKLREQAAQAASQVEEIQRQMEQLRQENERLRIIAAEYPQLSPLLDVGAIPDAESPDDFRSKLAALAERFVPAEQAEERQRMRGARPPASPPASPQVNVDSIVDEMRRALRDGDTDRFNQLREQWYAAIGE